MNRFIFSYLDAGSGSMLLQAILGGAAGLVVFFKATGRRLFRRNTAKVTETPDS